jgi:hypothetical protein
MLGVTQTGLQADDCMSDQGMLWSRSLSVLPLCAGLSGVCLFCLFLRFVSSCFPSSLRVLRVGIVLLGVDTCYSSVSWLGVHLLCGVSGDATLSRHAAGRAIIILSGGIGVVRSDFTFASPSLTSLHSRGVAKTTLHRSPTERVTARANAPTNKAALSHRLSISARTTNKNLHHLGQSMRRSCSPEVCCRTILS